MSTAAARRFLVTGGAGYVGSVLVPRLLEAGHEVRVADRFFFGDEPLAACRRFGDAFSVQRRDVRDLKDEDFAGFDTVIDLAGLSNDPSCDLDEGLTEAINVQGGARVLRQAKAAGVRRYVYQSSCSVYGSGGDAMLDESSELAPVSAYAESKLEMERRIADARGDGFETVISRMGTVYGASPRMRFDLIINIMTKLAYERGKIFVLGGGRQWRPLIHVIDAARQLIFLADAPAEKVDGEIFNAGSSEHNYRVSRVARMVADAVPNTELEVVPDDIDKRSYRVSFAKLEALGFATEMSPEDGIREILGALQREELRTGIRTRTVDYYRYLLDAQRVLDEIRLDGRLL